MCNSYNRQNLSPLERKLVCVALAKKQLKKQIKRIKKKSNILWEANQEILKASKNNHDSGNALQLLSTLLVRICSGRFASCFIYGFVSTILTIIPTNLLTNQLSCLFYTPVEKKKQESDFLQVNDLVARNFSAFCLQPAAIYFKDMPNSTDLSERIFSHVIPAGIVVPCKA